MIRAPSNETPVKISNSPRWYPYFKDCVREIDGTHVYARVPAKIQAAFRGRKHYPTQNILAAIDFDLKFTYVLAGWEGSAHDATILADALEREDGLRVPPGEFYLVDAGYACRPRFLPPYHGTRYHLKEYGPRNYPTNPRELFNLRHSSLRVSVERDFGALKNHFCMIDNKPFHPCKTQVKVDEVVPAEFSWVPNNNASPGHGVQMDDNAVWTQRMAEEMNAEILAANELVFPGRVVGAVGDDGPVGAIRAHPKDAEYLNKPIHHYQEMMVIFGNGQATGKYAIGSNKALGSPSDFADSPMKHDLPEDLKSGKPEAAYVSKLEPLVGSKRKRSMLLDDDVLVFTDMTDAVNNVADAIRSIKVEDSHPDLYSALMYMPGFSEEALMVAYGHLLNNKAQGSAFVQMSDSHRVLWLSTYLDKNYYM
ncbi:uncharacterized protein [Setaria viridis]|uniref:uncharacterized protein n=1 Tax=Setaria viridis TaxID=4556 RepID=UPI001493BCFE|nr:uncharacterized protein LOC117861769 [Setaria viridis]